MKKKSSTEIWGKDAEADDFIKVPRALLMLGRYCDGVHGEFDIQPRHILLFLVLASYKFQEKPIRRHWETIAQDLGVKQVTVRKWAYELKNAGLLKIKQNRGRDPLRDRPGYRNESNTFDISPFVNLVREAVKKRKTDAGRKQEEDP